jgi:hypothetical protein
MPPIIDEILSQTAERWTHCEGQSEATLLRLNVLRELASTLHATKSQFLATGKRGEAQSLKSWESKLEELRGCSPLDGNLLELLNGARKAKKRTRVLPDALFTAIEREKLERYDRQWEGSLAAEAVSLGWRFWSLGVWVQIALIEDWDKRLREQLWPHGIVLFTESAGSPLADSSDWHGRWIVALHPKFRTPAEISLDFARWSGTVVSRGNPEWKLLFSPRSR